MVYQGEVRFSVDSERVAAGLAQHLDRCAVVLRDLRDPISLRLHVRDQDATRYLTEERDVVPVGDPAAWSADPFGASLVRKVLSVMTIAIGPELLIAPPWPELT